MSEEKPKGWLFLVLGIATFIAMSILIGLLMAVPFPAWGSERIRLQRGELEILARVVQAEATGEPAAGQRAVAWTVVNRMKRPDIYGATLTRVILAPYQYAKPVPLDDSSIAYLKALRAVLGVLLVEGDDPSLGSTHFLRCDMKNKPLWARRGKLRVQIGDHCFYTVER